ncbi:hypothetical protein BUALT_Bualt11G0091400 [Buddleja alternifolia]|uniref:TF-B3 domain-containing protein n=1 Tax=Buddleja alternifolia TaxID=168488 RepID=A0AAV6WV16_9LAMI|nr:hypothetical protein BUALT_Bualt11G0091400 [Buddleja alternifolia]
MTIPASFAQHARLTVQSRLTVKTILATFSFGVERVHGLLMLERAEWQQFRTMHGLHTGDFIHFYHQGGMVFHATAMIPSGSSKKYEFAPVTISDDSSTGEDDDNVGDTDDSSEENEETEEDDDDMDVSQEEGFQAYGLDSQSVAKLKPIWKGTAVEVQLKWKGKIGVDGQGTCLFKDCWIDFVTKNNIKTGQHLAFVITGGSGDKVKMEVTKLRRA